MQREEIEETREKKREKEERIARGKRMAWKGLGEGER